MTLPRREIRGSDGSVISYSVLDGTGPTVVILHGLAGSSREFIPTARALDGRRVILVDQRGHGFSTRVPPDVSREAFVDDVVRVIEEEAPAPVDLVGQSMGAHTAMLVAAARPDLVRRLVLLEGNEGGGSVEDLRALSDFFRSWDVPFPSREVAHDALGDGELAQAWVADLEEHPEGFLPRFDVEVIVAILRTVSVPRWEEWEQVVAPTLVVYADGGMFTEEQQSRFVARGRNAEQAILVGASHDAHLDEFEQWIDTLTAFLAQ